MKLKVYPKNVIKAAMSAKNINIVSLAKQLNKSTSSVHKAIKGSSTIPSETLNNSIIEALQPELEVIYDALMGNDILKGNSISPGIALHIAGSHS